MTGWQITFCYALTLFTILCLVLSRQMPAEAVVEFEVRPPQIIYLTPPLLPDRNPKR